MMRRLASPGRCGYKEKLPVAKLVELFSFSQLYHKLAKPLKLTRLSGYSTGLGIWPDFW